MFVDGFFNEKLYGLCHTRQFHGCYNGKHCRWMIENPFQYFIWFFVFLLLFYPFFSKAFRLFYVGIKKAPLFVALSIVFSSLSFASSLTHTHTISSATLCRSLRLSLSFSRDLAHFFFAFPSIMVFLAKYHAHLSLASSSPSQRHSSTQLSR
jgi:hypothetical protein